MPQTHYKRDYCHRGNRYKAGTTRTYSYFRTGYQGGKVNSNNRQEGTSSTKDYLDNVEGCRSSGSTSGRTFVVKKYDTYLMDSTYTRTDGKDENDVPITITDTRKKRCQSSRAVSSYDNGQNRETHTYNDANGNAQERVEKTLYGESSKTCTPVVHGRKFNVPTYWEPDWSHYLDPYANDTKAVTTFGECHELLTTKQPDSNNTKFYSKYDSKTVEPCPSTELDTLGKFVDSATQATYELGSISGCYKTCVTKIGYGDDVVIKIRGDTENEERKEFRSLMFETYMHGPTGFIYEECGPTTGKREPATFKEFIFLGAFQRQTGSTSSTSYAWGAPFGDMHHPSTIGKTAKNTCAYRGEIIGYASFTTPDVDYGITTTETLFQIVNEATKTKRVYDSDGKTHELFKTTIKQTSHTYTYYGTSSKSYNTAPDTYETAEVTDENGQTSIATTRTIYARAEAAEPKGN